MRLFGAKDKPRDDGPRPVVLDTRYVKAWDTGAAIVASVVSEKYTERESQVIQNELGDAAAGRDNRLAVDMSRVAFLASAGVGSLVTLHKTLTGAGGRLVLFGIDEEILAMLKIAQLHRLLTIVDDESAALAKIE